MARCEYCSPAAYELFTSQIPQLETTTGLVRAATAVAMHAAPTTKVGSVEHELANYSAEVASRVRTASRDALLAHLHAVLFDEAGFRGNVEDYYHVDNSYLPQVLQTRRGLPISLVLVYKAVAEPLGLRVSGINSPGHFLAAIHLDDGLMYVDPFHGGTVLTETEALGRVAEAVGVNPGIDARLFNRATHAQWISRMLNNLQAAFARQGRERDLAAMRELQTLLNGAL